MGAYPLIAKIGAPSTEKDALFPIHPGAAAYFAGEEQSFFVKYGDWLTYGSMVVGSLASILAAAWKFLGFGAAPVTPLDPLNGLADRIRQASSESELAAAETNWITFSRAKSTSTAVVTAIRQMLAC